MKHDVTMEGDPPRMMVPLMCWHKNSSDMNRVDGDYKSQDILSEFQWYASSTQQHDPPPYLPTFT